MSISRTGSHPARSSIRRCSAGLIARSWRHIDVGPGQVLESLVGLDVHRMGERRHRLRTPQRLRPRRRFVVAAVHQSLARGLGRHRRHGRLAVDDEAGLHSVARRLGTLGQVDQALAVGGQEGGDVDEPVDRLGAPRRGLGDHHAAHAVADQHGGAS